MKFRCVLPVFGLFLVTNSALFAAPASNPAPSEAPTTDAASILNRYQLALDQLSQGNLIAARLILEDGIRRFGANAELNLLLGYVLQKEGKNAAAAERLLQIPTSPVASAFVTQLRTTTNTQNAGQITSPLNTSTAPVATLSGVTLAQTDARLTKLEGEMADMVNAERTKAGLKALIFDEKLASVARAHSAEMRDKNYFAHESPTTGLREPMDRYVAASTNTPHIIAENIFRSWGSQRQITNADIKEGHVALMKSAGHRANILYPDVTHIGIGVVSNSRGDVWITQMFLRP